MRARNELYVINKKIKFNTLPFFSNNLIKQSTIDQDSIAENDWITQLRNLLKSLVVNKTQHFNNELVNNIKNKTEELQIKKISQIKIRKLINHKQRNAIEVNNINNRKFQNSIKHFYSVKSNINFLQNKILKKYKINSFKNYLQKKLKKQSKRSVGNNKKLDLSFTNFSNEEVNYKNVEKLKKIINFCQMLDYCQNYMNNMGDSNSRLFN